MEKEGEEKARVSGSRGFYTKSSATSYIAEIKTVERHNLHWFFKFRDTLYSVLYALYSVLWFKDDFITRRQDDKSRDFRCTLSFV